MYNVVQGRNDRIYVLLGILYKSLRYIGKVLFWSGTIWISIDCHGNRKDQQPHDPLLRFAPCCHVKWRTEIQIEMWLINYAIVTINTFFFNRTVLYINSLLLYLNIAMIRDCDKWWYEWWIISHCDPSLLRSVYMCVSHHSQQRTPC